jgi:hypothetical protein
METSQNIRKGVRSSRMARTQPPKDWDSFSLTIGIPKDPKGVFPLPAKPMISHRAELRVERPEQAGRIVEALSPQQWISWRRVRPKKNKEAEETRTLDEPYARSCAEKLLMRAIRLEPVEGTSRERRNRTRGIDVMGINDKDPS